MDTFETLRFYHGFSRPLEGNEACVIKVNKERTPRDTPNDIHLQADTWFEKRFGIKYRSQAVFATSSFLTATGYAGANGVVARVIPLDRYAFCWSPKVRDFLMLTKGLAKPTEINTLLDAAGYIETDLRDAFRLEHEVMLCCSEIVALPTKHESRDGSSTHGLLVLPQ